MTSQEYDLYIGSIQRRIVNSIWRIVRDGAAVEDLVRDVVEQVVRKIRRVRAHENPHALVLRMAVQRALDFARTRARRHNAMEGYRRTPEPDAVPGASRDECEAVLARLRALPKREAEALWLHAVEEMSYAEVAASMGCRPATVRVLAARGRKRLKGCLSDGTVPAHVKEDDSCERR